MLNAVMSRMTQRIAGSLARELKELPEKVEQEQMTTALQRLFHLQTPQAALAGTRLERKIKLSWRKMNGRYKQQSTRCPTEHWTGAQAYILRRVLFGVRSRAGISVSRFRACQRYGRCATSKRQQPAQGQPTSPTNSRTTEGNGGPGRRTLAGNPEDTIQMI